MYVVNPLSIDESRLFSCPKADGLRLIYETGVPVFGISDDGAIYYFIKTEALLKILEEIQPPLESMAKKEGNVTDEQKT